VTRDVAREGEPPNAKPGSPGDERNGLSLLAQARQASWYWRRRTRFVPSMGRDLPSSSRGFPGVDLSSWPRMARRVTRRLVRGALVANQERARDSGAPSRFVPSTSDAARRPRRLFCWVERQPGALAIITDRGWSMRRGRLPQPRQGRASNPWRYPGQKAHNLQLGVVLPDCRHVGQTRSGLSADRLGSCAEPLGGYRARRPQPYLRDGETVRRRGGARGAVAQPRWCLDGNSARHIEALSIAW
jgi:hypothetical protein